MACEGCDERREKILSFVDKHVRPWVSPTRIVRSRRVHVRETLTPEPAPGKDDKPTS